MDSLEPTADEMHQRASLGPATVTAIVAADGCGCDEATMRVALASPLHFLGMLGKRPVNGTRICVPADPLLMQLQAVAVRDRRLRRSLHLRDPRTSRAPYIMSGVDDLAFPAPTPFSGVRRNRLHGSWLKARESLVPS